jgi:hypothetical protein
MKSLSGSLGKRGNDLVSGGHSTMSTVQQKLGISIKAEASTLATASAELTDSYTASRLAIRLVSSDMVEMFSHASPLIREVINVDGAILFDASLDTFGGGTERVGMGENTRRLSNSVECNGIH